MELLNETTFFGNKYEVGQIIDHDIKGEIHPLVIDSIFKLDNVIFLSYYYNDGFKVIYTKDSDGLDIINKFIVVDAYSFWKALQSLSN